VHPAVTADVAATQKNPSSPNEAVSRGFIAAYSTLESSTKPARKPLPNAASRCEYDAIDADPTDIALICKGAAAIFRFDHTRLDR
jgi:hypothetical protein